MAKSAEFALARIRSGLSAPGSSSDDGTTTLGSGALVSSVS